MCMSVRLYTHMHTSFALKLFVNLKSEKENMKMNNMCENKK